jgi:hypothetical protein
MLVEQLYQSLLENDKAIANLDFGDLQQVQRANVKFFIIACASFFEGKIKRDIRNFVKEASANNRFLTKLVKEKLTDRNYYNIIDWKDTTKLKSFLKSFGVVEDDCNEIFQNTDNIDLLFNAYLQIGITRNKLVHGKRDDEEDYSDILNVDIEQTLRDIYSQYNQANQFVDLIPSILKTTVRN